MCSLDDAGNANGMRFSTFDNDNDNHSGNCATDYDGAWWYNACDCANLNGLFNGELDWYTYGGWNSFKTVNMLIKDN